MLTGNQTDSYPGVRSLLPLIHKYIIRERDIPAMALVRTHQCIMGLVDASAGLREATRRSRINPKRLARASLGSP